MRVLITGASGFIGKSLCDAVGRAGFDVLAVVRKKDDKLHLNCEIIEVGDIGPETDWSKALAGVDIVIHLAGRAHIPGKHTPASLKDFHEVNVAGTKRLAQMAAYLGVKKIIFLSSVKVNGEGSLKPYTESDILAPQDAYGISKMEAEEALFAVSSETGLKAVILRSPLVYGPQAKANFHRLMKIVEIGLPLPFQNIHNRRSFIYLDNLVDAIITCITHPLAAGEIFMVSDGQDISTPDLIKMVACAMKKRTVLFSLYPGILKMLCKIIGRSEELEKLIGTLIVDSSKIRNVLGWKPRFSVEEGIAETVRFYKDTKHEKGV